MERLKAAKGRRDRSSREQVEKENERRFAGPGITKRAVVSLLSCRTHATLLGLDTGHYPAIELNLSERRMDIGNEQNKQQFYLVRSVPKKIIKKAIYRVGRH